MTPRLRLVPCVVTRDRVPPTPPEEQRSLDFMSYEQMVAQWEAAEVRAQMAACDAHAAKVKARQGRRPRWLRRLTPWDRSS